MTPLDDQMGVGHLNANRAFRQYRSGEYDPGNVPLIGWDYGHTTGKNNSQQYSISQSLVGGSFISLTLAWDRRVQFMNDAGTAGVFDQGDTFKASEAGPADADNDDQINDLDIWLLPQGSTSLSSAIARSTSPVGTLEQIFFQIPTTGNYDFWVVQGDEGDEDILGGQNYAVAWWAAGTPTSSSLGDYNGDDIVDGSDYGVWRTGFGSDVFPGTGADGDGDGTVDSGDYLIWRKHDGMMVGSGSGIGSAVPEPESASLLVLGMALGLSRTRGRVNRQTIVS